MGVGRSIHHDIHAFNDWSKLIPDLFGLCRGIFGWTLIAGGLFIDCMFIPLVGSISIAYHPSATRYCTKLIAGMIFVWFGFVFEYIFGIKVSVTCTPAVYEYIRYFMRNPYSGALLFMSNHRTRLDGVLVFSLLARLENIGGYLIIVLKKSLQNVPFFGWALQWIGVFIHRKWTEDKIRMAKITRVFTDRRLSPHSIMLFFPEGTDLFEGSIEKSNRFAEKNNLPKYQYVLHPRTTGMVTVAEAMDRNLLAILDCTVGYIDPSPNERANEITTLLGRAPKQLLFHVEAFDIESILSQYKESQRLIQSQLSDGSDFFYVPLQSLPENIGDRAVNLEQISAEMSGDYNSNDDNPIRKVALEHFIQKSFYLKEGRLAEWYENNEWIKDCHYKMDLSGVPYSTYFVNVIAQIFVFCGFFYLWRNARWWIYGCVVFNVVSSWYGLVEKKFLTYLDDISPQKSSN